MASVGISNALFSTAFGLVIAISSLAFYRLFQGLIFYQSKIFQRAGNDMELLYRQTWSQTGGNFLPGILTNASAQGGFTSAKGDGKPLSVD